MVCKGTCIQHIAHKPFVGTRYGVGQKRCSTCEIFIKWDGNHCPCCNFVLRIKPKSGICRKKLMMYQQINRI